MGIISILVDCIIFCILFITLSRGMQYWINVVLYLIAFIAKCLILYGTITFQAIIIYLVIGAIIVWILQKVVDAINPLYYMIIALLTQEVIMLLIGLIGILK